MSRTNSQLLGASVQEFIQIWALSGDATLNLTTSGGQANIEFKCTLGHPGAPHTLPPSVPASAPPPAPQRPRHRGPSERERNRVRAARHQAAQAEKTASSITVTDSVPAKSTTASLAPTVTAASTGSEDPESGSSKDLKCEHCDYTNNTVRGLGQHVRMMHKIAQVDGIIDPEDNNRDETITSAASEMNDNYSDLEGFDSECFHMLGVTETCAISCEEIFSSKEECYKHMYLSHSKCCIKLRSNMEKNGYEDDIRNIGYQKVMLEYTLSQI